MATVFYWTIYNENAFKNVFRDETFYYYNNTIYQLGIKQDEQPCDLDILKEIEKYKVIMILFSGGNYGNPGMNFSEMVYKEIVRQNNYKNTIRKSIGDSPKFSAALNVILTSRNITKDSAISIIADSLARKRSAEIAETKIGMRKNQEWLKYLFEKSRKTGVPIESVMQSDAEWVFDNKK